MRFPTRSTLATCVVAVAVAGCSSSQNELSAEELRPQASWTAEEQQIVDLYTTFREELGQATSMKDGDLSAVTDLSSPRLSEALTDTIVGNRSVGNLIEGDYVFTPLSVTIDGEDAKLLLCAWDQTYMVNEGDQLTEVPEEPTTATVDMNFTEGQWLVNGLFDGEGQPCDLT